MKLNIERAIKAPLSQQNIGKLLMLALGMILFIAPMIVFSFTQLGEVVQCTSYEPCYYDDSNVTFPDTMAMILLAYTFITTIPLSIYYSGYMITFMRNVFGGNENMPEFTLSHFKTGLKYFGYILSVSLSIMLIMVAFVLLGIAVTAVSSNFFNGTPEILIVMMVLLGIPLAIVFYIFLATYMASSALIYIKTDSIKTALSLSTVHNFVKENWKTLLLGGLVYIGFSSFLGMFGAVLIMIPLLGIIAYYALTFYFTIALTYILGDMFGGIEVKGADTTTTKPATEALTI